MKVQVIGKDFKVTEAINDYAERKLERIDKYFEESSAEVIVKSEKNEQIAEVVVKANGEKYIAAAEEKDLYASIDKVIDILEGQIRKMKTKKDKQNMTDSIRLKEAVKEETVSEVSDEIIKVLYYDIKPMTPEDAKLKLQEQPQNKFLAFIDIDTGKTNVIYRLKDSKNFGIVEPEA